MRDLVILVPDNKIEAVIQTLPEKRAPSLGIREIEYEIYGHPRHDPGVRLDCVEFLRPFSRELACAIVIFDHEGSGSTENPVDIEGQIERGLVRAGWRKGFVCAVVIDPELELWAWNESNSAARTMGWGIYAELKNFLRERGLWKAGDKPQEPKRAFEEALPLSASIYRKIAEGTSLADCKDRAFNKLKDFLVTNFPCKR